MTKAAIIGGELDSDLTGSVEFYNASKTDVKDIDDDDDPIVLFVDMDGGEGAIKTSFTTAAKNDSKEYINNAVYVTTTKGNIKVLVVDAGDNDLTVSKVFKDAQ